MAGYTWNDVWFLPHKVRNLTRRGYLLKTYNDGKILRARVKSGDGIENDKLDVVHPVGYVAHVKASEKTEIITMDIGGDSSRRVVLAVLGDREYHPKPDEGEAFLYAPGNSAISVRVKMAGGGGGSAASARDSGRAAGIHMDAADQPMTAKTTKTFSVEASESVNLKSANHTIEGDLLVKGNVNIEHDLRINGEGYKPSDGEWLAGGVAAAAPVAVALSGAAVKVPLSRKIRIEGETVVVDGDLRIDGDLHVTGVVRAKDFVKA